MEMMFEQYGFACDTATNGVNALEMIEKVIQEKKRPYQLILVDQELPMVDGLEVANQIVRYCAENNASGAAVPFTCLLMTIES